MTINDGFDSLSLNPIGAFYECVTPANDPALSIADKTYVLLDSTNKGITASALASKDTNRDGKLNGTELSGLNMWQDLNENGFAERGEISTLSSKNITALRSEEYGIHTQGNAKFASAAITSPTKINTIQNVPASNFRTLRDTDNVYYVGGGRIYWAKNQIKINYSNRSYLIGTDGNDSFDSNYYAKYTQYFNSSLLVNFLAGGGNDFMGGSARNDNLWGGTGADTLLGYANNQNFSKGVRIA